MFDKMNAVYFDHLQSVSSEVWTITHNLNKRPSVEVFSTISGVVAQIFPRTIKYPDLNTAEITFTSHRTGNARLR